MRRALRSRKALLVALLVIGALGLPALAAAKPVLAVGDQKASMFADPRFRWLNIRHSRLVVSWRVEQTRWERELVAQWIDGARRAGVRPLIAFGHVWGGKRRAELPSVKEFTRTVADFRKRYPWVRDYTPWNEANHCSQPTCNHPERAAAYYNVLRAQLQELHDRRRRRARPAATWSRGCARSAATPRATRGCGACTTTSTPIACAPPAPSTCSSAVKGTIWMTETGGIVRRTHYKQQIAGFEESPAHAATATAWILRLANRYHARPPRVPVPVERELDDPGVGLGADRTVRRAPARVRRARAGHGPRPGPGARRPRRDARPAPVQRAAAAHRLQPAPAAVRRSAAPARRRRNADTAATAAADPAAAPAVHAADLHARRLVAEVQTQGTIV